VTDATAYAPAPAKPTNRLGVAALILVVVACFVPPIIMAVTTILAINDPNPSMDAGWALLGGFVFGAIGLGVAGPIAIVGVVLAIIALTRKNFGKVAAIVALVIGIPLGLVGLSILPLIPSFL
jgi:hypothetical protein